jgi:putative DNA primase/helicase
MHYDNDNRPRTPAEHRALVATQRAGQWLKDACRVEVDNRTISDFVADLFKSWTDYAEASGERAGSQKGFVQSLTKNGFKKGQRVRGGQLYTGLQLHKPAAQQPSVRD